MVAHEGEDGFGFRMEQEDGFTTGGAAGVPQDAMTLGVFADEPAEAVVGGFAIGGFLWGEEELERTGFQKAGLQERGAEADEVFGCGEVAAASPFVAAIHFGCGGEFAEEVIGIKFRAVGIGDAFLIGAGVFEVERLEDVFIHVADEVLLQGGVHGGADKGPAVSGVIVFRAGRGDEGIVLEDGESGVGIRVGLITTILESGVMADAGEVAAEHAGGDGCAFIGKIRNVFLDGGVEIDLAALDHEGEADGGEGFGDAADAKFGFGGDGLFGFEVHVAEAFGPDDFTINGDSDGDAGDFGGEFFLDEGAGLGDGVGEVGSFGGGQGECAEQQTEEME